MHRKDMGHIKIKNSIIRIILTDHTDCLRPSIDVIKNIGR